MIYQPETVKGFQDFLPPESQKRDVVRKVVEKYFKLYGFLPVETPIIEYDELMRQDDLSEKEDEAISDRFRLKDKGARNLALRYEFTFQLKRLLKQNPNLKMPFRRYQIGSVFRDEPISPGRFREFTQCDVDVIGEGSVNADAECVACFTDILDELKIKYEINVNNRKLLEAIVESVQISDKTEVMRELDKIDKVGEDMVKANLRKFASVEQVITLFRLLEKDLDFFKKNLFDGAEEIDSLISLGKKYGFKVRFNPYLARGLSYYTGNVFEVSVPDLKMNIGGGGRYDNLIGKYSGREIPAVGFSFGLERLTELATAKIENTKVVIISLEKDKECVKLSKVLRKSGISCVLSFGKPGKALDYANAYGISYAIFVGEDEIKKNKFNLKDLNSGKESLMTEKQLIKELEAN